MIARKRRLRQGVLARRAGSDPGLGADLAQHVRRNVTLSPHTVLSGYWPMPGEIDIRPLLIGLHEAGHVVLLPRTPPMGQPLTFHRWQPGDALVRERFGTFAPDEASPSAVPQVLFVPLVAFDRTGRRLGYGGGFYDRTLAGLTGARAIGCGFACQEVDAVPAGEYDVRLSAVATERGLFWCENS